MKPPGTIVSEDPRLEQIYSDYSGENSYGTGPWTLPQNNGWIDTGNVTGSVDRVNQSMENWHMLLHPRGRGPPYFWEASVSQDVVVPLTGNPRLVVEAQNVNHLVSRQFQSGRCEDSFFQVYLVNRITGKDSMVGAFTAGKSPVRKEFGVSRFRGLPVKMKLVQRPGGRCGTWRGEHATINRFYLTN